MSKWDKLLTRIRELDKNMRFDEIRKIMESYGYTLSFPSGGSSHGTFRKPGRNPITIPTHEPIKKTYIIIVKELIEMEEEHENDR